MPEVVIRRGDVQDILAHLPLLQTIQDKANLSVEEVCKRLRDLTIYGVLVAETNPGEAVGMIVWYAINSDSLYLWLGAVAESWQNKGIAGEMIQHLREETHYKHWFAKVRLSNAAAVRVLEAAGFAECQSRVGDICFFKCTQEGEAE